MTFFLLEHTDTLVHVAFPAPRPVLSSAVFNGGLVQADHIVNLNVDKNADGKKGPFEPSEVTLGRLCGRMGWQGTAVGLMTAAGMGSFRTAGRRHGGLDLTAMVTAGVSNAMRAGEPPDGARGPGTINIIVVTDARLEAGAMVEAVQMITEAKTAVLQDMGVKNRHSGRLATGTGTDAVAVAVAGGTAPEPVRFCGKHTRFGELLASAVIEALTASLSSKLGHGS